MSHDFFSQKAVNCAAWLEKTVEKYDARSDVVDLVSSFVNTIKTDKRVRDKIVDPAVRIILLSQAPPLIGPIQQFREFYSCSEEERLVFVDQGISALEQMHQNFGSFLQKVKDNRESAANDFKTLGAYAEIFFGAIIDNMKETKQQ